MTATDHLEIGTLSFERCDGEMMLPSSERLRLILAAVEGYWPDLLVTAGHAVDTVVELRQLADDHAKLACTTTIVTEVLHDQVEGGGLEPHAMWAITGTGDLHRFGQQQFAKREEIANTPAHRIAAFERALPQRSYATPDWNLFALLCGELNIVEGRDDPRYVSSAAEAAIMAADIVINPTHDRMGNAGTLIAKRKLLSRAGDDNERQRVYVSCSNWDICSHDGGEAQHPSGTLHTVYASGEPQPGKEWRMASSDSSTGTGCWTSSEWATAGRLAKHRSSAQNTKVQVITRASRYLKPVVGVHPGSSLAAAQMWTE